MPEESEFWQGFNSCLTMVASKIEEIQKTVDKRTNPHDLVLDLQLALKEVTALTTS